MVNPEARLGTKIAAFAVVAGVGLAACGSEVAGQAAPGRSISTNSEAASPSSAAPETPDVPALMTESLVNAPGEQPFDFALNSYSGGGTVVDRLNEYEYGPSVVKGSDGTLKMWFCGGGGSGAHHGDSIWYSVNASGGMASGWSVPVEVVRPSNDPADLDYAHACDPSVVRKDGVDYIAYTGATDWGPNGGACTGQPTADGCDNRIFLARVADNMAGNPQSYQKLVDVGNCADRPECFDWKSFWQGTEYPPVPIISDDPTTAWRRAGTSNAGTVVQQTHEYGVGQPSMVIAGGNLAIWYTNVAGQYAEDVAVAPLADLGNASGMTDQNTYTKHLSNANNGVNYDVAFDVATNRFVATTSAEYPGQPTNPLGRPRIDVSPHVGDDVSSFSAPVISGNLTNDTSQTFVGAQSDTFNSGFLHDPNGNLATEPSQPGSSSFDWVCYGDNRSDIPNSAIGCQAFELGQK